MDILLLLGIAILCGMVGGKLLQRLGIPQVVGYILIGLLLGDSISGLLPRDVLYLLNPLNQIALGFIGRITSYNVCYTKLLREKPARWPSVAMFSVPFASSVFHDFSGILPNSVLFYAVTWALLDL